MLAYYIPIFLALIAIFYKRGYILDWFTGKYQKAKLILALVEKITHISDNHPVTTCFAVNDSEKSAHIIYERLGSKHILNIPFDRKQIAKMAQLRVFLLRKDQSTLDITQQPGIPYLVSANDLGGETIKIINDDNERVCFYHGDKIPHYMNEIFVNEIL